MRSHEENLETVMKHLKDQRFFVMLAALGLFLACGNKTEEQEAVVAPVQETQAICMWDEASLRASPSQQGKWLSAISLGEKVAYLGETALDSSDDNKEYSKVRLSDGKDGWINSYLIIPNAKAAALVQKTSIYKRPDVLTGTNVEFGPMNMVAVKSEKDDWIEVVGSQKKKSGWVKNNVVSYKDEDVAVAILAAKALAEKDPARQKQKLEAVLNNPAFAGSVFISELQNMLSPGSPVQELPDTSGVEEKAEN